MDKWQFYTKPGVSKNLTWLLLRLLGSVTESKLDKLLFIEPSAGYGCFYDSVSDAWWKIIGFDIEPKHSDIKEADFLKVDRVSPRWAKKNTVIIWNPPFWKRAKLAIEFFNKSAEFGNTIGFIVPKQFDKYSVQSRLHPSFKLIHSHDLENNSFYVEGGKDYGLNTVFQVWTRNRTYMPDLRITHPPEITHADFTMWQYNSTPDALKFFLEDFDFAVLRQGFGDYHTKLYNEKQCDRRKQRMLVKAKNKTVLKRLMKIEFEALSRRNTIVPGFGKADLVDEYKKQYG